MTSRDTSEERMPSWPMAMPSVTVMVQTCRRAAGLDTLLGGLGLAHQGNVAGAASFQQLATPTKGWWISASVRPMA